MTRFEILNIIRAGGATLNSDGESVHYTRGYQVSRKDCYTLDVKHVARILRAVNSFYFVQLNACKLAEHILRYKRAAPNCNFFAKILYKMLTFCENDVMIL